MTPELNIDTIGQIHLTVDDLDQAVGFYRDVLGMKLLFEVREQSMAFFDCSGVRLYLGRAEEPAFRSSALIYYRVDSVDEACTAVEARGAEIRSRPHVVHRTESHELWMAGLEDPSGNQVMLMSEKPV